MPGVLKTSFPSLDMSNCASINLNTYFRGFSWFSKPFSRCLRSKNARGNLNAGPEDVPKPVHKHICVCTRAHTNVDMHTHTHTHTHTPSEQHQAHRQRAF